MSKFRTIITLLVLVTLVGCNVSINSTTSTSTTTTTAQTTTDQTTTTEEQTTTTEETTTTTEETTTTTESNSSSLDNSYYKDAIGKTGDQLKRALNDIIDNHTKLTYDEVKYALRDTDEDPNNSNNVILLYTGRSQAKSTFGGDRDDWNREHVWAKSHGDFGKSMGPGTDLHHLRPTDASVNSTRGNKDFDYGGNYDKECKQCKTDSDSWEPSDNVKGDVARMIFYMAVRYEGEHGEVDLELNDHVNNGSRPYMGRLSVLLEWNRLDPVDEFEMNRNNVIYEDYQGNRNPFIDHPEWAELIWNN
ncbi:endonuclease [Mycoplasmatota bacterium]|nr:endonuclease [Mycoplasmatota bacterium]